MIELERVAPLKCRNRRQTSCASQSPSIARIRVAVLVSIVIAIGCSCGRQQPTDPAILELLGPDDGSQIVVLYGSEIMGNLDGCGCMGNPKLGGFPYRLSFARSLAEAIPHAGILQVDAGFTASLITTQQGSVTGESEAALETTLEALAEAGFAAVNVTSNDIPIAKKFMGAGPVLERYAGMLVSANLEPVSASYRSPAPFVIREVGRPGGKGVVRIAIVGITEFPGRLDPSSGFRVTEPRQALERAIADARSKSEVVIVLAYMPAAVAGTVFVSLEAKPDVVIVASSFGAGSADGSVMGSGLEPQLDGVMKVVYSWYKTQKLGVLRLKLDEGNRVMSATNAYVKLDAPLVPDPAAERMVARQKEAVRAAKEARYRAEGVQPSSAQP